MNTLIWNNILKKRGYPITTFVYTSNKDLIKAALTKNCVIRGVTQRNEFGLPLMSFILQDLKQNAKTQFLSYINSDILLNPETFSLLRFVSNCHKLQRIHFPVIQLII